MRKKLQAAVATLLLTVGMGTVMLTPVTYAASCNSAADCIQDGLDATGGKGSSKTDPGDIIQLIVKILLYIIGAVSVIMIIIGGVRYTISQGDSAAITAAKNTILYAVIGLIVAIFAYAIVDFVVSKLAGS